jgi:hypothetical protein
LNYTAVISKAFADIAGISGAGRLLPKMSPMRQGGQTSAFLYLSISHWMQTAPKEA